jgi:hypothetical protein
MANVRVYNDNKVKHVEKFKGDMIEIPAGEFLEMQRDEAVQFKSQFFPPIFDKAKNQTLESMKCIRLAPLSGELEAKPEEPKHNCMKCGQDFKSLAGLNSHIRAKHAEAPLQTEMA